MTNFRPTLSAKIENDDDARKYLKYPLLGSPKIDGMRVVIHQGRAVSRTLIDIPNRHLQSLLNKDVYEGFDGECVSGSELDPRIFLKTMSHLRTEAGTPEFTYWVFDSFHRADILLPFQTRLQRAQERIEKLDVPFIRLVEHKIINNFNELVDAEAEYLSLGFEGLMCRDPNGSYKFGRSTKNEGILFKLKRGKVLNGDAEIIGFEERMQNNNEATVSRLGFSKRSTHKANMVGRGDLGAFLVRDIDNGSEFSIGTGVEGTIDDAFRSNIWSAKETYLGKVIRYEHFGYGAYEKPRFPKFVCFRDKEDIG